jgi:broad specificity phosphatase PhoE
MKTRLILVRHAEAEGNDKRLFQGWTDGLLTEKGHMQAKVMADRLQDVDIDLLYSSSLMRTKQTAQYISDAKNLPIIVTDKLREIHGGDWENEPWSVLPEKWPEQYEMWEKAPHIVQLPNGESMPEFYNRLVLEIESILEENEGKNLCIVTHGTAIRALMCFIKGCPLEEIQSIVWYDNTAITIADYENGKFEMVCEGDSYHLGEELCTITRQDWFQELMNNEQNNIQNEQ